MSFIKNLVCSLVGCKMEHKGSTIMKNFTIRYYVCKRCNHKTEDTVHHDIV
ncbi:hypothetical protein SAGEFAYGE_21 [Bacillus phage SageFayge]|uniref:Uncharacterized protein n=1 Tax=Bacillus phage SageFayge TaxID=1805954 RepID=A0A143FMT1_9CAUD|nr:hypothetical protein BI007_gp016 [Bacillus phage DIGNKC]YP_009280824.1 hypothetical protein SAGEFAYGE_21 [Bacillus phage SageFayge]AOZ61638.1 hypothetical protein BJ4_15 [Bacillus phage BJ4]UGO46558.1 hypothetical protein ABINADI_241 [Bacillus phage vB_BanH_Abinadi]AMW62908.1 hypothetical protein DIGNKC_16 [Bacillus phage DIGNKC]AMW62942.1 hypothetical protein SAGEFAYGE_21 [Bacillus phage SageFayge]